MRRLPLMIAAVLAALTAPASAALPEGAKAPPIITDGAMAGKAFRYSLSGALARGPVVVYFYPKAFTQGCTLEARAFAEAMGEFRAAGATVIGLSADDLATLQRFSTEECRDAFPVGIATPAIIKAYDVQLVMNGKATGLSERVSYVIGRDGRIAFVHSDLDWRDHVRLTLAAVRRLKLAD